MNTVKSLFLFTRTLINRKCRPKVYADEVYRACEQGDLKKVKEEFLYVDRNKLLSIAIGSSNRWIVEFLLKPMIEREHAIFVKRPVPTVSEEFQFEKHVLNSCLEQAVRKNSSEMTELLLRAGAKAVVGIRIAKAGTIMDTLCKYDE